MDPCKQGKIKHLNEKSREFFCCCFLFGFVNPQLQDLCCTSTGSNSTAQALPFCLVFTEDDAYDSVYLTAAQREFSGSSIRWYCFTCKFFAINFSVTLWNLYSRFIICGTGQEPLLGICMYLLLLIGTYLSRGHQVSCCD